MRKFVSAACCAIVGLEILIGVPIAVCLGFFCVGGQFSGTYVAESPPVGPIYAPANYNPPPLPAALPPPVCAPSGNPVATFDPYVPSAPYGPIPAAPRICPAPSTGLLATLPAHAASLPASDPAADPPLATNDKDEPQFVARVSGSEACAEESPCASPGADLNKSLYATAELLYRQADRHEVNQEYDFADRLRTLARDLRDEAISIQLRARENDPTAKPWPVRDPLLGTQPSDEGPYRSAPIDAPPASETPSSPTPAEVAPTASVGPPPLG